MKTIKYLITALVLTLVMQLHSQSDDVTKEPGYVDFGDFTSLEKSAGVTEVELGQDVLSALASISSDEDPNIMAILNGLKLVRANVYEIDDKNRDQLMQKVNEVDSKLSNTSWKRIVRTRSEDETANVYIKMNSNKKIIGLVVTSFENSGEAAFVNIVGQIDLATIGKLGKKFDIPSLDDINRKDSGEK
ncbi:DUF4252 domain-containing protein [bacterium BMS3Abin03]|jgi:hypothetical protein|nr:DUF4252 domain-containing protein [bacterium BMS3Abin03]MCG6960925.1 DUF4252 domain-containing protein [bacterium BMS3Abin03]